MIASGVRRVAQCSSRYIQHSSSIAGNCFSTTSNSQGGQEDTESYDAMLSEIAKRRLPDEALKMLDLMRSNNELIELSHYTSAIVACESESESAIHLLTEMEESGLDANITCLTAAAKSCEATGAFTESFALNVRLKRLVLTSEEGSIRRRLLEKSHEELSKYEMKPLQMTYSLLISENAKEGNWKKSFRLLNEMVDKGIKFPFATLDVAASICKQNGRQKEFEQLTSLVTPDTINDTVADVELDSSEIRYGSSGKHNTDMSYYELLANADFDHLKELSLDERGRHRGTKDGTISN